MAAAITTVLPEDYYWNSTELNSSDTIPVQIPQTSVRSLPLYKVRTYLWYFGAPAILLLGNFGNIMTLIIMRRITTAESVVNIYFTALAIADLVTLDVILLGDWVGITFRFYIKYTSDPVCKIWNWVSTATTTISAWILVCLSVHRALSVVWPHRVNVFCTRRRVSAVLLGIVAVYSALYCHNLYGYRLVYVPRLDRHYCLMRAGSYGKFVEEIFTYVDLTLYSLLPFLCLLLANGVLVFKLRASVKVTRHAGATGEGRSSSSSSDNNLDNNQQTQSRQKATRSVTLTVILVSVAFIVLTLPVSLYYVLVYVAMVTGGRVVTAHYHAMLFLVDAVTYLLMYSNNAINFYLYCLTGKRFREEFFSIICCCSGGKFSDGDTRSKPTTTTTTTNKPVIG